MVGRYLETSNNGLNEILFSLEVKVADAFRRVNKEEYIHGMNDLFRFYKVEKYIINLVQDYLQGKMDYESNFHTMGSNILLGRIVLKGFLELRIRQDHYSSKN